MLVCTFCIGKNLSMPENYIFIKVSVQWYEYKSNSESICECIKECDGEETKRCSFIENTITKQNQFFKLIKKFDQATLSNLNIPIN